MTLSTIANVLLILVLVGWFAARQLQWRPVLGGRDWRFPALAAVIGAALLAKSLDGQAIGPIDVAAFVTELVIALGLGAAMGAIAHIRPISRDAGTAPAAGGSARAAARAAAVFESRTSPWGLSLWVVLIAVRIGLSFLFESLGSHLGVSTGLIVLVLAANRAARTLVLHARLDGARRAAAGGAASRIMVS